MFGTPTTLDLSWAVVRVVLLAIVSACSFSTRVDAVDAPDTDADIDAPPEDAMTGSETIEDTPLCNADPTLRACYAFENTTDDGSSYNNDLTAPSVAYVNGRTAGGMALLTTSNTYTTAATTSLDITTFTFKMWIRPNAIPVGGARMGLLDSGGRFRVFLQTNGAIRCAVTNGVDLLSATSAVSANAWQRVTCRYDGATMQIYVNGTMVGSSNTTSTVPSTGGNMVIGHNNPSGENFNGAIDDLQIFSALVAP
jgi:hypothetical protein